MDMLKVTVNKISMLSHDTLARVHGTGLLIIIFASFFPFLIHELVYFFFGLLALSITVAWTQERLLWVRTDIDKPLLLLIGWILLTVPFAANPAYSFMEWRKLAAQGLMFYWVQFVLHHFKTQATIRHVLMTVVVGTVVFSGISLIIFQNEGGQLFDRGAGRARLLLSDANWLATYLILVIPIIGSGLVMAGLRQWKVVLTGTLGIAIVALYCSYMRAGWIALMAMGIAWGVIVGKRGMVLSALGISIGFLAIIVGLHQFGFFVGVVNLESVLVRINLWSQGFTRLLMHPIIGNGYGQLTEQMILKTDQGPVMSLHGLHSLFLMVAVGSGVPGLILLVWLFLRAGRALYEKARAGVDPDQQAIAAAGMLMVIGIAVRNVFDYMFAGSLAYLFWILLAVALGSRSTADDHAVGDGWQTGVAR